jgi:uncharacterized RDD family membrane protein YckC
MSRIATGDRVVQSAGNNVFTVLAIIATLVNIIGFAILVIRFTAVFGDKVNLFQP